MTREGAQQAHDLLSLAELPRSTVELAGFEVRDVIERPWLSREQAIALELSILLGAARHRKALSDDDTDKDRQKKTGGVLAVLGQLRLITKARR